MEENKIRIISGFFCGLAALVAVALIYWLSQQQPDFPIEKSVPGMDKKNAGKYALPKHQVNIGEFFLEGQGVPERDNRFSWPRFRGQDFDNICKQQVKLADKWPENGPEELWRVKLGEGHAAPVINKGRVYLLDYDEDEKADALRCLSLADGKEIWRRWYRIKIKRNHGMSRTIPAVNDQYVVTIGPKCQVMCVRADTGDLLWGLDLEKKFGTKIPLWYTGQCALLEGNIAVIAPGGKDVLMMGIDCATGKTVWQTANPHGWAMSHSSIIPMELAGKRTYVYPALGGIVGISAEKDDLGELLWANGDWNRKVIAPSAVPLGDDKIMVTAGYGGGSMILQITRKNNKFTAEAVQEIKPNKGLACEQQTPVFWNNRLFAVLPKDAGPLRQQFVCADPEDLTEILWSSGKTRRYGLGPFIMADNKFYILSDDGILTMARADTEKFDELAKAKVLPGHDAWGPIAIAGTKMLLRDSKNMVCIDVGEERINPDEAAQSQ